MSDAIYMRVSNEISSVISNAEIKLGFVELLYFDLSLYISNIHSISEKKKYVFSFDMYYK